MKQHKFWAWLIALLVPAAATGQAHFHCSLQVNNEREAVVWHDEAVTFSLSMRNYEAWEDARYNRSVDGQLQAVDDQLAKKEISAEAHRREREELEKLRRRVRADTLGSAVNPWQQQVKFQARLKATGETVKLPVFPFSAAFTSPVAVLDGEGWYSQDFGIRPEQLAAMKPGEYDISVSLAGESSNAVKLVVREQKMPPEVAASEAMRLKLGRFFLAAKELGEAANYTAQILLANPNSLDGSSLQGEILLAQGKYLDALFQLNRALEIFNQTADTQEEPEHLLELIERAREKRGN
ncbi:MAG: hypothetical protein HY842_07890 [Bacteroidetes bacterium]|nr:hypothetical protein [Bacteroidota bacterium]